MARLLCRITPLFAVALLVATGAAPVRAQYGSAFRPTARSLAGELRPRNHSAQFYPLARFGGEDAFGNTGHANGVILAGELGFVREGSSQSYKVGGWYFAPKTDQFLYDVHGTYYFSPRIGLQVGTLGGKGPYGYYHGDFDAFLLFNISSDQVRPGAGKRWAVQLAPGLYHYNGISGAEFTWFVQGSLELANNLTLDTSYWYIKAPGDLFGNYESRVVLGVGYRF